MSFKSMCFMKICEDSQKLSCCQDKAWNESQREVHSFDTVEELPKSSLFGDIANSLKLVTRRMLPKIARKVPSRMVGSQGELCIGGSVALRCITFWLQ